jgi:hypothetical protein
MAEKARGNIKGAVAKIEDAAKNIADKVKDAVKGT